jgi:two-component system phosphate regulon response regulator PhoB
MVCYHLLKEGYQVSGVGSGEEALALMKSTCFDVVLLDLMLPGVDGLTVCKELKSHPKSRSAAIIMITAKRDETDIIVGLKLGADDYVTKPFSPKVLVARVQAVLRRLERNEDREIDVEALGKHIAIHDLLIHPGKHRVYQSGVPIELSHTEFRLLSLLAGKPGWVFTRHEILNALYGKRHAVSDRAVDVQIVGLRKKLGTSGDYIKTVRGVGYRLDV